MPLPEDFPAYLIDCGFHYIPNGLWGRVTGRGLECCIYAGDGEWIVQNRTETITALNSQQVYDYIEANRNKNPGIYRGFLLSN